MKRTNTGQSMLAGLLLLAALIIILYLGWSVMSVRAANYEERIFFVDDAAGLKPRDMVLLGGREIGRVRSFARDEETGRIAITVGIRREHSHLLAPAPESTARVVASEDRGRPHLMLMNRPDEAPVEFIADEPAVAEPEQVTQQSGTLEEALASLRVQITQAEEWLASDEARAFRGRVEQLQRELDGIGQQGAEAMQRLVDRGRDIAQELWQTSGQAIREDLRQAAETFHRDTERLFEQASSAVRRQLARETAAIESAENENKTK